MENKLNIISHNCIGARIYQQKNMEYGNPFMWSVIPPEDFWYLNKYHVPHVSIILVMSYISNTVRKKKAQAMFITDDKLSAF